LKDCGFECVGVDANPNYVKEANSKGNEVFNMNAKHLEFPDKFFDTALLFEVLEHIDDPAEVLKEAKRVSKKNVLITVPDCTGFDKLSTLGLTFEHMLEKDHVHFFTKSDLEVLLSEQFNDYEVKEAEPVLMSIVELPRILRIALLKACRWRLIRPLVYYRLYAVAKVE
jgi:ubiquinone/menaquinone biosynthesis C-methylase UbiE